LASINTENSVSGDVLILTELMKHLRIPKKNRPLLLEIASWGGLAVETFLEQAISKISKVKRSNTHGEDFVNGWEAKKCTVIYHTHGTKNSTINREATIKNIHKKHGDVLIVVADSLSNELFYFKIPAEEIKGRKSITITCDTKGGALKCFRSVNGSVENSFSWRLWNLYRKSSFKELCTV
jgi:predicted GIY-YIG superfamily endonuclease